MNTNKPRERQIKAGAMNLGRPVYVRSAVFTSSAFLQFRSTARGKTKRPPHSFGLTIEEPEPRPRHIRAFKRRRSYLCGNSIPSVRISFVDQERTFQSNKIEWCKEHLSTIRAQHDFPCSVAPRIPQRRRPGGVRPRYPSSEGASANRIQPAAGNGGTYRKPCGRGSSVHRLLSCRAVYPTATTYIRAVPAITAT